MLVLFYFIFYFIAFLERGEGREEERERSIDVRDISQLVAPCIPLNQRRTHDPVTCPDQESNQRPFALLDSAQPTEPNQSRLGGLLLKGVTAVLERPCNPHSDFKSH